MAGLSVLSVASELYPLVKTGGLADVTGALPAALANEGIAVRSLIPGYPAVLEAIESPEEVYRFADLFGAEAWLRAGRAAGLDVIALDAPHLFRRPGGLYAGPDGADWPDNAQRFAALCLAASALGQGEVAALAPDIVHAHDWQAGLAPAYLHYQAAHSRPGIVMTVHNMAYQGQFPAYLLGALRLPAAAYAVEGVEYYGSIGFLKAGLQFADRITTVSPTYAEEVQTDQGGMGLGGLIRARAGIVSGILNGIDDTVWNPATDPHLPVRYDARSLSARATNTAALRRAFDLQPEPPRPLFGVVSRLAWQKGMDLLLATLPRLLALGGQLALIGTGEPTLEGGFRQAATAHAGRIGVRIGYDEPLAHLIQGGCDVLLVPSRFEPCGLTQLCALRYGALPLVSRVGGLADTVIDANEMAHASGGGTGFQFAPPTSDSLEAALMRARRTWDDRSYWQQMQRNAMATEVGWREPARRYAALYRDLYKLRRSMA